MRERANGLRRGELNNISQTLSLVLDKPMLLPVTILSRAAERRGRCKSRPVVEIEEILKEAGGIKKEEDMQIDVNRILIVDIN